MIVRRVLAMVVVVVVVLVAACGGDDGDTGRGGGGSEPTVGSSALDDLLARLPDEARLLATIDLAAAREQLDLPADASVDSPDALDDPDTRRLLFTAGAAIPYLALPQDVPLKDAIDTGAVTAAASTGGGFQVVDDESIGVAVLRTDQPFDDIAQALESDGYERDGDLVVADSPVREIAYPVVTGDDGVVILAQSEAAADDALAAGGLPDSATATVLGAMTGTAVLASAGEGDLECGNGFGLALEFEPMEGELLIFAGPDPDPNAALPDADRELERSGMEPDDPEVDGEYVRVPFAYDPDAVSPLNLLTGELPAGALYDGCDD